MRTALRLIPAGLCMIVLSAHFLRAGFAPGFVACLLFPGLFALRRSWVRLITWAALSLGTVVWILTALRLVMERQMRGQPWLRMAFILGGVAVFNLVAAFLLRGERMRTFFRVESSPQSALQEE